MEDSQFKTIGKIIVAAAGILILFFIIKNILGGLG